MDFLTPLVNKYQRKFKNPVDVLDWVAHDLKQLGLGEEAIKEDLDKAKKILTKETL